ncbi:MAG: hypothetical protein ACYC6C_07580 [Coriobacteriia bacterium]
MTGGDWKSIFALGESFHDSAQVLWNESVRTLAAQPGPVTVPFVLPAVVCTAFSIELFLKALLTIETGGTPRVHSLKRLFGRLSTESATSIERHYDQLTSANPNVQAMKQQFPQISVALSDVLVSGDRAFEEIRYAYEGHAASPHGLNELARAVRNHIAELTGAL